MNTINIIKRIEPLEPANKILLDQLLVEKGGIDLPDDFYNYLTQESYNKLLFFGNDNNIKFHDDEYYFDYIDLYSLPSKEDHKVYISDNIDFFSFSTISEDMILFNKEYFKDDYEITFNDLNKWMINIGQGHYFGNEFYIYIGEGPYFGSIWQNWNDSIGSCEIDYGYVFATFSEFRNYIKEGKNNKCDYF